MPKPQTKSQHSPASVQSCPGPGQQHRSPVCPAQTLWSHWSHELAGKEGVMLGLASGTTVATQPGWGRLSAERLPSSRSSWSIPPQQRGNGPALPSLSFPAHGAFLRVPFPALGTNNHQHHCWAAPQPLQPPPNQQRAPKLSPTQGSAGGTPTKTTQGSAETQHTPTPSKNPHTSQPPPPGPPLCLPPVLLPLRV